MWHDDEKPPAGRMPDVTELLLQWNSGDDLARSSLMEKLYEELRSIAKSRLSRERHAVELQPSALVNEAYLKLIDLDRIEWHNRAHFLAMSSKLMRDILIDHARRRNASKRDGGQQVTLSGLASDAGDQSTNVLALHEALERLAKIDEDRARLVELRFFGGLTIEEAAKVLDVSPATVKRSWDVARGWLFKEMNKPAAGG